MSTQIIALRKKFSNNRRYLQAPFTAFNLVNRKTVINRLNLNWSEQDLPEKERTKHVHRLHPYLGKFIPQLVEIFLRKYSPKCVLDPFCGSGTTLVEALSLGIDSIGCDVSSFNCLVSKVKTDKYNLELLEKEVKDIRYKLSSFCNRDLFTYEAPKTANNYLNTWFAPKALEELLFFKSLIPNYRYQDLFKVVLSRAARSARYVPHHELDFPKKPQIEPYHCRKHRRICTPVDEAFKFLDRYCLDAFIRIKYFSEIRTKATVKIYDADSRKIKLPPFDFVFTSPPYVGLIDYHEQHRYAYELLELPKREELEIGPASKGVSKEAKNRYIEGINFVWANIIKSLKDGGILAIVVGDKWGLYNAKQAGFKEIDRIKRHVNRRTGRRNSDFYEEVLIWRKL